MSREKKRIKSVACHNCHAAFADEHQNYCAYCGQENHTHKLPVGHFVMELIESLTHFDTKFFQTFVDLVWKPGLVIKNYNDDKRARYFPPVRIYFFTSFIFFLILSYSVQDKVETTSEVIANGIKNPSRDSLGNSHLLVNNKDLSSQYFVLKDIHNLSISQIDSVNTLQHKNLNWLDKHIFLSLVKIRNGELSFTELYNKFIKYFSYALFILMPLFALILKIFYQKRNYFYAEFLVFSIYFHTFIFGASSIYLLLEKLFKFQNLLPSMVLNVASFIYLYLSLKRVFNNSVLKTIYKTLLLAFVYFICFLFIFVILVAGSFL